MDTFHASTGALVESTVAALIKKMLEQKRKVPTTTDLNGDMGELFGFCAPTDNGDMQFKTLFVHEIRSQKVKRITGAACAPVSNRKTHEHRILYLHTMVNDTVLAPLLLLPTPIPTPVTTFEDNPTLLSDIPRPKLCLYMEFLTRLFESILLNDKHWFLDTVCAVDNGFAPLSKAKPSK